MSKEKDYIKSKLKAVKSDIDLDEFNTLANSISNKLDSKEYDEKMVKKVMAKYANIKDGKILFNTKEKSNLEYKTLAEKLNKKQESSFFNFNLKRDSKDSYDFSSKKEIKKEVKKEVKKEFSDSEDEKPKKIIKSFTKKEKVVESKPSGFSWGSALKTSALGDLVQNNQNDSDDEKIVNTKSIAKTKIKSEDKLNTIYEYTKDFHYIPKIRLDPRTAQSIYDQQNDDVLDDIMKARSELVKEFMSRTYAAQKSEAWHAIRKERTTASDGGCVLHDNHYEPPHKFLFKKVMSPPFQSNINCYNGNKYEQIATMIYAYRMNVDVEEFGLIVHPTCKFLAASPDGIISPYKHDKQHLTKHVGRMLEIKCPTTRQIKTEGNIRGDICPVYYWDQVQLQLECCNLDECDFWQCQILEYDSREDFLEDTDPSEPFRSKSTGLEKGIVIQLMPKRLPNFSDNLIKQLEEYRLKLADFNLNSSDKKKKKEMQEKFGAFIKEISTNCAILGQKFANLDITDQPSLLNLDNYIKYLLKGQVCKCEHSKNIYCNNWKLKDPDNCAYCEAVYAYSKHIYPPKIDMTPYEYDEWLNDVVVNYSDQKLLDPALDVQDYYIDRIIYWKLNMTHCITIHRDKDWYAEAEPKIGKVWSFVEYFRANMDKAKIFFDFTDSLTIKSTFMKDKDEEMSEEEIHRIMEVAEILCNDKAKNYAKQLITIKKETDQNILNKEEKIKQRAMKWKKKY